MKDYLKKLEIIKIKQIIKDGFNSEADVNYFFTSIRSFLEDNDVKGDFKVVKFYSDWLLHYKKDNIKRNETCF